MRYIQVLSQKSVLCVTKPEENINKSKKIYANIYKYEVLSQKMIANMTKPTKKIGFVIFWSIKYDKTRDMTKPGK